MATIVTTDAKGIWGDSTLLRPEDVLTDALIVSQAQQATPINGDSEQVRVPYIGADAQATITAEGAEIQESNPDVDEMTFKTVKLALLCRVSNEAATSSVANNLIANSVRRAVTAAADQLFINGSKEHPDVSGLLQGGSAMQRGEITGSVADGLDSLLRVIGRIGDVGGTPSALILGYGTWMRLLRLKNGMGDYLVPRDAANAPTPSLYGIPCVFTPAMPLNTILVHDRAETFASCSDITVTTDSSHYFSSDSLAVRCTFRLGWGVVRPDRFGLLTVKADQIAAVAVARKATTPKA